jgi:primosomal protein N''
VPNVLIRDVPADDLDQIRSAAATRGMSLQNYLRDALLAQAAYLRRKAALTRVAERLRDQTGVPADERRAVLDAIADAHTERADQLNDRSTP